jgi:hypothetical protein
MKEKSALVSDFGETGKNNKRRQKGQALSGKNNSRKPVN